MNKFNQNRTEFYETAVSMGFYGNDEANLFGKKDNVRKYWEDMVLKIFCRPFIEDFLKEKTRISILDLGCGSGEGFELLTHIPPANPKESVIKNFVLMPLKINKYYGIDVSPAMITQGKANYRGKTNMRFELANMEEGLPPAVLDHNPFSLYFSSYGALSHLSPDNLETLFRQIFSHAADGSVFLFDVHGKYSPEWPVYWNETKELLPYTMAYLYDKQKRKKGKIEWFNICYWTSSELKTRLQRAAKYVNREIEINYMHDRSIFVGRHMDTGLLSSEAKQYRYQVNRLIDHGYRGETKHLEINLEYLEKYVPQNTTFFGKLVSYKNRWNKVIYFLEALLNHQDKKISKFIESEEIELMEDEFKFLAWLFRNSDRFPVTDFWASVIGPQVAMILRNIENSFIDAEGCGHGLMCGVKIVK
jgi:SAM-dependent methyltransferase